LAEQYRDACGEKLVITSAVRPSSLRLINSVDKTVHPAGIAVDIRKPRQGSCLRWLRETLLHVEGAGAIEATEERRPPHFHVAVFPSQYLAYIGRDADTRPQVTRRASQPSRGAVTYRVRQGDSLWAIARRHNTSVARLKEANDMRSSQVRPGQVIKIPADR
ncbi:MAG TPA: LysM peptidoglycan-binding domain-containing protein, partial [Longimicrobium sp.]|nr:LysM peptidoglycan-binding domain-containing protein [Longimicrobium sp.]